MVNVDTKLLVIFVELLQKRNATYVAEKMHLTAPAVSHSLNRLREIFNDPLFTRVPHGLVPTPRALELESQVKRLLALWEQIGEGVRQFSPQQASGTLRMAYSPVLGDTLVTQFARSLQSQAPNLRVELKHMPSQQAAVSEMLAGELDLLFADTLTLSPSLQSESHLPLQQWLCGRAGHPQLSAQHTDEAWVEGLSLVLTPEQSLAAPVKTTAIVPNWIAQAAWVAESDAVCVLNTMTQPFGRVVFGLTCVPLPQRFAQSRDLALHWQASRGQQPMLQWARAVFAEVVTQHLARRDDWYSHLAQRLCVA